MSQNSKSTQMSQTKQPTPDTMSIIRGQWFRSQLAMALPKHITPDRMARVIITALNRQPKLLQATQESLFNALMTCSQLGLEPDGRLAHLIPYWNKKKSQYEANLIIDYKGLIDLAYRSGQIANIHADIVCEEDEFEVERGVVSVHRINYRKDRGKPYAVYAMARLKDGSEVSEVMTVPEVEMIRARSETPNNGPWVTDWNEMAKKAVFRRLSKWIPLSSEFRSSESGDGYHLVHGPDLALPGESSADQIFGRLGFDDGGNVDMETGELKDAGEAS